LLCNYKNMKYIKIVLLLGLFTTLFSCQDDEKERIAETQRTQKQNDSILKVISANWKFDVPSPTPAVAQRISKWNEWEQFNNELKQKPTGTAITAYLQKTKTLVTKADLLKNNVPAFFSKPQVRARMGVLITKIKSLYTYINIETIPDKKVIAIIGEITHEMTALQNQFDEIVRISEIPKEEGEQEMLKALDTTRMANPDAMIPRLGAPPATTHQPGAPKNNLQQARRLTPPANPVGKAAGATKPTN
jgi:hypothetical protein